MSAIASRYSTTYQNLAKYNSISDPNKIYVGQIIKVPKESEITPTTYVVKKGDTLTSIADKFGINWKKIYEKNKSKIENPNKIYPGQVLSI